MCRDHARGDHCEHPYKDDCATNLTKRNSGGTAPNATYSDALAYAHGISCKEKDGVRAGYSPSPHQGPTISRQYRQERRR